MKNQDNMFLTQFKTVGKPLLAGSQKKKNLRAAIRQYVCTKDAGISRS